MAIVKMKKLRLLATRDRKEALLKDLLRCGCVEISEPKGELSGEELAPYLQRENSRLAAWRTQYNTIQNALGILNKVVPASKGLLQAKPQAETDVLLDEAMLRGQTEIAGELIALGEKQRRLNAEESRLRSTMEALRPWSALDLPLETTETERCSVLLGTMPARTALSDAAGAMESISEEAELLVVSEDKSQRYLVLVCMKEDLHKVQEVLRPFGFSALSFGNLKGTSAENLAEAESRLKNLAEEKASCEVSIAAMADRRSSLELAADAAETWIAEAEAEDKLCRTESVIALQGWMPAEKETELAELFERYDCAWETEDPDPSEYPEVPVQLKNNKLTDALNMVTTMYSLPAYDGVDPNPLMAPFFILFYGLMMADMGYGLLMIAAAIVAMLKIKPKAGTLSFCRLLLYGGISTFVMGALTGGFFGNALEVIGTLLGKPEGWGVLPYLFSPIVHSQQILYGAMGLGLIHLNTGMVISAVRKVKAGDWASALWEEGSLWVTLIGGLLFALDLLLVHSDALHKAALGVLAVGILMILWGGMRGASGFFGKLLSIFTTVYNTATGWFGDILSYSRIMALMLAGSVIAMVFNTIGGIFNNLIVFILVFLIGHALNFALNLLGCYVHDLRLQCLEYFGKFYKDGGRPFEPLAVKTKYYDIVE